MKDRLLTDDEIADIKAKHWYEEEDGRGAVYEVFDFGGFVKEIIAEIQEAAAQEIFEEIEKHKVPLYWGPAPKWFRFDFLVSEWLALKDECLGNTPKEEK